MNTVAARPTARVGSGAVQEELDEWQQAVMEHQGNICICAGRQVGKSTVISKKGHDFAQENADTITLMIAASQRQATWIFEKTLARFNRDSEPLITAAIKEQEKLKKRALSQAEVKEMQLEASVFAETPTKTKIVLKNGSVIYCLPAGKTGVFIMGLTIDLLIADEAAYIPECVWNAVLPMLAVSRKLRGFGWIILLSKPFGKGGFFYNCTTDMEYKYFHISSEECKRIDKAFLLKEKARMSKVEYAQEYLAEFIDDVNQFFPTPLIKDRMTFMEWTFEKDYDPVKFRYYLGVDIARYGGDENAFVVAQLARDNSIKIVKVYTTTRVSITDTIGRILKYDALFHFAKIFVDDAGVGGGPTDMLLEKLGRKVIGLNNASRRIEDAQGEKKRGILKEDLYSNALVLMESKKIELINSVDMLKSLKSILFNYNSDGTVKISGNYTHICEGMVRACWCIKEKGLQVYIA